MCARTSHAARTHDRVLSSVNHDSFTCFTDLFDISEGRQGVVVTFMAMLELIKQQLVELVQAESYARFMSGRVETE